MNRIGELKQKKQKYCSILENVEKSFVVHKSVVVTLNASWMLSTSSVSVCVRVCLLLEG